MPIILACLSGIAALALLVFSGLMAAADLTHPFWQMRASAAGAGVGLLLAVGLLWITQRKPDLARALSSSVALALCVAIFVTWRAARTFIDSADFEPTAGQLWFLGYHVMAALIVAFVAIKVAGALQRD